MAFWMVGLVALVAIGALVLWILREQSLNRERVEAELHLPDTPTLEYVVPTGEDPVVVLAALERAGYTAGVDSHGAQQVVLIKVPDGVERSRAKVRAVIEYAGAPAPTTDWRTHSDVRFRDERA
jgi:hypothetical protein